MTRLPSSQWRWCTKHASEQCGVGITLQQWDLQSDNFCPWFNAPESCLHVILWSAHGADEPWSCNLAKLRETLTTLLTPEPIQDAIVLRLTELRQIQEFSTHDIGPQTSLLSFNLKMPSDGKTS